MRSITRLGNGNTHSGFYTQTPATTMRTIRKVEIVLHRRKTRRYPPQVFDLELVAALASIKNFRRHILMQ